MRELRSEGAQLEEPGRAFGPSRRLLPLPPAVPPLTARFAAFSNDFCFSCSLYAAHDKEGESFTGC